MCQRSWESNSRQDYNKKNIACPGDFPTLLTSVKFDYIILLKMDSESPLVAQLHTQALASLQNKCLELYLSTSDNLVSSMVRVIKWHINIKAYNTVTLSFIASINPKRQTFHSEWPNSLPMPPSCPQHSLLKHLHLSSSIYLSIQAHLAIGFQPSVSSKVAMMLLGISMKSFRGLIWFSVCSAKPQRLLWNPHQIAKIPIF